MPGMQPLGLDGAMLDEACNYLRIDNSEDDPTLAASLLAAIGLAEGFTGSILLERQGTQMVSAASGWQRLPQTPVLSITGARGIPAEGASFALEAAAWQHRIDRHGDAHVQISRPGIAGRVEITLIAGMAENWSALPEAIRMGVLRLTGHLYTHRDASDDAGPPAAVAALLRPWRRMRLSAGAPA